MNHRLPDPSLSGAVGPIPWAFESFSEMSLTSEKKKEKAIVVGDRLSQFTFF